MTTALRPANAPPGIIGSPFSNQYVVILGGLAGFGLDLLAVGSSPHGGRGLDHQYKRKNGGEYDRNPAERIMGLVWRPLLQFDVSLSHGIRLPCNDLANLAVCHGPRIRTGLCARPKP